MIDLDSKIKLGGAVDGAIDGRRLEHID